MPETSSGGQKVLFQMLQQRALHPQTSYRIHYEPTVGQRETVIPDAVFQEEKVAVFYDGCYWHECPQHHPFSRKGAVLAKDRRATAGLTEMGWTVIRAWEHGDLTPAADAVEKAVRSAEATIATYRAAHIAKHEHRAWCGECTDWRHQPWPIDTTGYCLRCMVHAEEEAMHLPIKPSTN